MNRSHLEKSQIPNRTLGDKNVFLVPPVKGSSVLDLCSYLDTVGCRGVSFLGLKHCSKRDAKQSSFVVVSHRAGHRVFFTMTTTTQSFSSSLAPYQACSSPQSVVLVAPEIPSIEDHRHKEHQEKEKEDKTIIFYAEPLLEEAGASFPDETPWHVLPASQESQRTRNPIRAVVDPILARHHNNGGSNGHHQQERDPQPEFISLAVRNPLSLVGNKLSLRDRKIAAAALRPL